MCYYFINLSIKIKFSSNLFSHMNQTLLSENTAYLEWGEGIFAQMHMASSQYVTFLAPRRVHRVESGHRCVAEERCADTIWETKGGHQVYATRVRARPRRHPVHIIIIKSWHILLRCPSSSLCAYLSYIRIELLSRREFHAHTYTRTHTRAPWTSATASFDQADSKGWKPLPPVATDVRHVWSFTKIGRLEQLGNFRFFFLFYLSSSSNLSFSLSLYPLPSVSP